MWATQHGLVFSWLESVCNACKKWFLKHTDSKLFQSSSMTHRIKCLLVSMPVNMDRIAKSNLFPFLSVWEKIQKTQAWNSSLIYWKAHSCSLKMWWRVRKLDFNSFQVLSKSACITVRRESSGRAAIEINNNTIFSISL